MKHYRIKNSPAGTSPFCLFDVRMDIQDVRSGFRASLSSLFSGPLVDDPELNWTVDMVQEVDSDSLDPLDPPLHLEWPSHTDEKIMHYLTRFHRPTVWRNPVLGVYAASSETLEEFQARCLQLAWDQSKGVFEKTRDVLVRRFLEAEQRWADKAIAEEYDPDLLFARLSLMKDVFLEIRDGLTQCLLRETPVALTDDDLHWRGDVDVEVQERLTELRNEFVARYNEIVSSAREQASECELYEVPVGYSEIQIVGRGILWS